MTRRYLATTFSIAVAGALAIAACSTDEGGGATVCTEVTQYRFLIIRSISARFKTLSQLTLGISHKSARTPA